MAFPQPTAAAARPVEPSVLPRKLEGPSFFAPIYGSLSDSESTAGSSSTSSPHAQQCPLTVTDMLQKINSRRLGHQRAGSARGAPNTPDILASGPRRPGQGCEEEAQAIMVAEPTRTGGARLRITLLAAGFVIGPEGDSVRSISNVTGADVRSRTVPKDATCPRDCREFTIEGSSATVTHALSVLCDAVDRYKQLTEGKYQGQIVPHVQHVSGVDFFYQPPPRSKMPQAASLKGHTNRSRKAGLHKAHSTGTPDGSSSERRQGQKHSASNDSVVPLAFKSGCTGGPGSSPPFQTRPPKSPVPVSAPLPVMPTSLQMTHMGIDLLTPGRGPTETQQKEQQQQSYVNVVLGSSGQNLGVLHAGMAPTSQAAYMFAQPGGMLAPLSPLMLSQGTTSTASMLGASHPQHAQQAFGNGLGAHRLNYLGVQHAPKSSAEHVLAHLTQELQQALQLHSHEEPPISKDPHTNSNPHQAAQGLQGATADGASMFFSASQDPFGQDSDSASLFGGYSTSLPVTRAVSVDSDGSMGFSPCAFESPHSALQLPTSDGYWTPFSTPLQDISRAASRVSSLDGGSRGTSVDLNQPQWPQDGLLRTHGSAAGEPLVDSNVGSGDWEAPGTMPSLAQWQLFTSPKGAGASSDGDGLPVKNIWAV